MEENLRNMFPAFSMNNARNLRRSYIKLPRELPYGGSFETVNGSNSKNLFRFQFGCLDRFAHVIHTLPVGIHGIFLRGSKPQVIGIDASWIIPSRAIMTNEQAFWNWSIMNLPRKDMGWFSFLTFYRYVPVAVLVEKASPEPTGFSLVYQAPKAFFSRKYSALVVGCGTARSGTKFSVSLGNSFGQNLKRFLTVLADSISITTHRISFLDCGDAAKLAATNCAASFLVPSYGGF